LQQTEIISRIIFIELCQILELQISANRRSGKSA